MKLEEAFLGAIPGRTIPGRTIPEWTIPDQAIPDRAIPNQVQVTVLVMSPNRAENLAAPAVTWIANDNFFWFEFVINGQQLVLTIIFFVIFETNFIFCLVLFLIFSKLN